MILPAIMGATGAWWTPKKITTALWLDAADSDTITLDGSSNVEQWDDKSGNDNHATQTASADRPSVNATGINNSSIDFNDDFFNLTTEMTTVRAVFFVTDAIMGSGGTANVAVSPILGGNTSNQHHVFVFKGTDYDISLDGNTSESGHASVDGGSLVSGGNIDLGLSVAEKEGKRLWYCDWNSNQSLGRVARLNAGQGSPTYKLIGEIGEVVVLSSVPSTDTRQKIEGYLAHKWGLAGNLPSGHPYKSRRPRG